MSGIKKGVGARITELRQLRGMTLSALARALKTSRTTVYRLESGAQPVNETWLERVANVLDFPITDLILTDVGGRIVVKFEADADRWVAHKELPIDDQFTIELPEETVTRQSFGVRVTGAGQANRLPIGSIGICRPIAEDEHLKHDKLYFVRESKDDKYRLSFKELKHDKEGRIWLSPPDPAPEYSAIPLNPSIAILGIVTGAYVQMDA